MHKALVAATALALGAVSLPAQAGVLNALVGTGIADAKVKGKLKKNGRIEVQTTMPARKGPVEQVVLLGLVRMAEITEAQGRSRFAVIKLGKCGTLMINHSPVQYQCKLTGLPLNDGETAEPLGGDAVRYYETANVKALRDVDPAHLMLAMTLARLGISLSDLEAAAGESAETPALEAEPVLDSADPVEVDQPDADVARLS